MVQVPVRTRRNRLAAAGTQRSPLLHGNGDCRSQTLVSRAVAPPTSWVTSTVAFAAGRCAVLMRAGLAAEGSPAADASSVDQRLSGPIRDISALSGGEGADCGSDTHIRSKNASGPPPSEPVETLDVLGLDPRCSQDASQSWLVMSRAYTSERNARVFAYGSALGRTSASTA